MPVKTVFLLFSLIAFGCLAQRPHSAGQNCGHHHHLPGCGHGLIALPENAFTFVPPPADFDPLAERAVVISVDYTGFTPEAQAAFDYAVAIWGSTLNSSVPISIQAEFGPLAPGVLGSAGPATLFRNFINAPVANTYYPVALANALRNLDLDPGDPDITCSFNSAFNWYFGTDGNCPAGQYDFVTVVLHELCHGLGFVASTNVTNGLGTFGLNGSPVIYDRFLENLANTDIIAFPNNSVSLGNELTGGNVFWLGAEGQAANANSRPELYAPNLYAAGSSISHLEETGFPAGSDNSLMTPFLNAAEAIHDPGPVVYGMFDDMGWSVDLAPCSIVSVTTGFQSDCDPQTGTYSQQLTITFLNSPGLGTLLVNGVSFAIGASPRTITLDNLPADGLPVNVLVEFTADPYCTSEEPGLFTAPLPCACPGDLTGDGNIDLNDLLNLLADMGCEGACPGDLNQSGITDSADLLDFLAAYGDICP